MPPTFMVRSDITASLACPPDHNTQDSLDVCRLSAFNPVSHPRCTERGKEHDCSSYNRWERKTPLNDGRVAISYVGCWRASVSLEGGPAIAGPDSDSFCVADRLEAKPNDRPPFT
jgi:hypothetical protein